MRLHLRRPTRAALPLVLGAVALTAACTTGTTDETAPEATLDAAADAEKVACLEGTWVVDGAREAEVLTAAVQAESPESSVARSGEAVYTFAEGVLTRTYTAWTESFTVVPPGTPDVTFTSTQTTEGSTTAPFDASGALVVVSAADASGVTSTASSTENGAEVTTGQDARAARQEFESRPVTWRYSCDGDTLRLVEQVPNAEEADPAADEATVLSRR